MNKIQRLARFLMSFVPARLPTTKDSMSAYLEDVLDIAGFPANDGNKTALLSMIMHQDSNTAYISKQYFVKCAVRAVAGAVAYNIIEDIRDAKKATPTEPQVI